MLLFINIIPWSDRQLCIITTCEPRKAVFVASPWVSRGVMGMLKLLSKCNESLFDPFQIEWNCMVYKIFLLPEQTDYCRLNKSAIQTIYSKTRKSKKVFCGCDEFSDLSKTLFSENSFFDIFLMVISTFCLLNDKILNCLPQNPHSWVEGRTTVTLSREYWEACNTIIVFYKIYYFLTEKKITAVINVLLVFCLLISSLVCRVNSERNFLQEERSIIL